MRNKLMYILVLFSVISGKAQTQVSQEVDFVFEKVQVKDTLLFSMIDSIISSSDLARINTIVKPQIPIMHENLFLEIQIYKYADNNTKTFSGTPIYDEKYWRPVNDKNDDITQYEMVRIEIIGYPDFDEAKYVTSYNDKNYFSSDYFLNLYKDNSLIQSSKYHNYRIQYPIQPRWTIEISHGKFVTVYFWYQFNDFGPNVVLSHVFWNKKLWEFNGK